MFKIIGINEMLKTKYFLSLALISIFAVVGAYLIFASKAETALSADFNSDGTVNIFDLSILAGNWGKTSATRALGDANGDGTVNVFDLSILASQWGQTASPSPTPTPPSQNSINIKIVYGAKGDGVSDDTTAINNALAAIKSGQTLYFPMGNYVYSGKYITPPDGVNILGDDNGSRRTHIQTGLVFGSNQQYKNIMFGRNQLTALTHKNNFNSVNTVFDNCRFRGGGPIPGVDYSQASSSNYLGYYPVVQLGGKDYKRSLSRVSFKDCEFERTDGNWVSPYVRGNIMSLWNDNRTGYSHIEYLTFEGCHFGVKNPTGQYGSVSANIELKTNNTASSDFNDYTHNWHDVVIKDTIFERSGDFNIDFTDSAREWLKRNGMTESGTTNGVPNWLLVPIKYHAGNETGRSVSVIGGQIKGAGYHSAPQWTYVFCLENPIAAIFTGVTAWGGARTNPEVESISPAAGPNITSALPNWPLPLQYDSKGMNAIYNNTYYPGVWGSYTQSPYDP